MIMTREDQRFLPQSTSERQEAPTAVKKHPKTVSSSIVKGAFLLMMLWVSPTHAALRGSLRHPSTGRSLQSDWSSASLGDTSRTSMMGGAGGGSNMGKKMSKGMGTATSTSTIPPETTVPLPGSSRTLYQSVGRALSVSVNAFSNAVLEGYTNRLELEADIETLLRFVVNGFIEDQIRWWDYQYPFLEGPPPSVPEATPSDAGLAGPTADTGNGKQPSAEGVNDYATNVQEEGVDEGDMIKSDGINVYAAYGDVLVVWNAITGDLVTNYTFPPINVTWEQPDIKPFGPAADIAFGPIWWIPKPYIQGMLLSGTKLAVFVGGYGDEKNNEPSMCYSSGTSIFVFDKTTMNLLTREDISGYYQEAFMFNDALHLVTGCDINSWTVTGGLSRWQPEYFNMTDNDYRMAAGQAAEALILTAKQLLVDEIAPEDSPLPKIPKISIWQEDLGTKPEIVEAIYPYGYVQSFTRVTSFTISDITTTNDKLALNTGGAFVPSSAQYSYMVGGENPSLLIAASSWNYSPNVNGTTQTTYVVGFLVDGSTVAPSFYASFPGYILNKYALSIYNGFFRVASTTEQVYYDDEWQGGGPIVGVAEPIPVDVGNSAGDATGVDLPNDNSTGVKPDEPIPPPVIIVDPWPQPRFITENQVIIFEIQPAALMPVAELGGLGKEGERITAVRFFGDIAYLVTFLQTDPLYAISLDPTNPQVLGALDITGFSTYLHSTNVNNTLLVGLGFEATEEGATVGLQVTLFDATDPANLKALYRANVEKDMNANSDSWSWSDATFDYLAFRYVSLGVEVGLVIIPVTISSNDPSQNFDGYVVYDVSRANGISLRMIVPHEEGDGFYGCFYNAYLVSRSFVFDGALTTTKGHNVISTDLDTGARRWDLEMLKPSNESYCVVW